MSAAEFQAQFGSVKRVLKHENHPHRKLSTSKPAQQPPALGEIGSGEASGAGRPVVSFRMRRVRLLDRDGKFAAVKNLCDGLQYAGLIRGDREDQIDLQVTQERVIHFFEENTEIEIDIPTL
jgi:hypothetical protein